MTLPTIPGYHVLRILGAGASCQVLLAREATGLQRPVALKVFSGEASRAAQERELEMMRRVEELRRRERVVGLVQALGSGEDGELGWIAFEYLEAGSLADITAREGRLSLSAATDCVLQAAAALDLLHGEGIFHRDVKPANILLGADGVIRLADFGLSRPLDATLSAAGSPAFAAPEVIAGKTGDGRLTDIYSLGATLAFFLTGETMLPGRPDVFVLERCGVTRPVQQVILTATVADPGERYATVDALAVALRSATQETAPAAAPAPVPARQDQGAEVSALTEKCGYAAAALTMHPIPGSEIVGVLPLHVALVSEIGRLYGVQVTGDDAKAVLTRIGAAAGLSLLGSKAAATAAKILMPGVGGIATAPLIYASTLASGTAAKVHFERGGAASNAELGAAFRASQAEARAAFDPSRTRRPSTRLMVVGAQPVGPTPTGDDPITRLERLADLLDRGLIDREDFDLGKARILGDL
jgi:uncharacterized protein (DUF697 family)